MHASFEDRRKRHGSCVEGDVHEYIKNYERGRKRRGVRHLDKKRKEQTERRKVEKSEECTAEGEEEKKKERFREEIERRR